MKKSNERRFVGLDVHKQSIMVGALNERQEVVLSPRRVSLAKFEGWAAKNLRPTDEVVLEATTNAWYIHDLLKPLVARVAVANPHQVKLIAASLVKTDKKDTLSLARLLAVNLVPEVWVPPEHVRELRGLTSHRQKLIKQRTAARNRLHAILHRHHILPPDTGLFSQNSRDWWEGLALTRTEKLRARHDLSLLDYLTPLIAEVDTELAVLSVSDTWADQTPFLIQLPGIGLISAMTILGAIGDIERFPSAKKLVGYSGLGARIFASGDKQRTGGITKQGRRDLRRVLVESAWVAVQTHPVWKEQFETLASRIGKPKAIVAIARKLLVVIWHVLKAQAPDRHARPEAVARTFLVWGTNHRLAKRLNLSRAAFVSLQLQQLGLRQQLDQFSYSGRLYKLPPPPAAELTPTAQTTSDSSV